MPDLTLLALPDAATARVESALCMIHADWLERQIKTNECCRQLFDVIAEEILATRAEDGTACLELLQDLVFDVAIDKGWLRLEAERSAPRIIGEFSVVNPYRDPPWFPRRPDWFNRDRGSAPMRAAMPKKRVRLGHHEVFEDFANRFRASFAGRIERFRAKAIRLAIPAHPAAANDDLTQDPQLEVIAESTQVPVSRIARNFRRRGQMWELTFDGATVHMRDAKGISYICDLLRCPNQHILAVDLMGAAAGRALAMPMGSGGAILDDTAISSYRRRLSELESEIEEAVGNCDLGRREVLEVEREQLKAQLCSAVGLGGRRRIASDDAEKARKAVSAAISRAIVGIRKQHRPLADHLQRFIDRGWQLIYTGDGIPWNF